MSARKKTLQDYAKDQAIALTNLNLFAAIVTLLEGGRAVHVGNAAKAKERIIKICRSAELSERRGYDHALACLQRAVVPATKKPVARARKPAKNSPRPPPCAAH